MAPQISVFERLRSEIVNKIPNAKFEVLTSGKGVVYNGMQEYGHIKTSLVNLLEERQAQAEEEGEERYRLYGEYLQRRWHSLMTDLEIISTSPYKDEVGAAIYRVATIISYRSSLSKYDNELYTEFTEYVTDIYNSYLYGES